MVIQERIHRIPICGPIVTEKVLTLHQKIGSPGSLTATNDDLNVENSHGTQTVGPGGYKLPPDQFAV